MGNFGLLFVLFAWILNVREKSIASSVVLLLAGLYEILEAVKGIRRLKRDA